jgi:hypothetical protein
MFEVFTSTGTCPSKHCTIMSYETGTVNQTMNVYHRLHGPSKQTFVTIPKDRQDSVGIDFEIYVLEKKYILHAAIVESPNLKEKVSLIVFTNNEEALIAISMKWARLKIRCWDLGAKDSDLRAQLLIYKEATEKETNVLPGVSTVIQSIRSSSTLSAHMRNFVDTENNGKLGALLLLMSHILPPIRSQNCALSRILGAIQKRRTVPDVDIYSLISSIANLMQPNPNPAFLLVKLLEMLYEKDQQEAGLSIREFGDSTCTNCSKVYRFKEKICPLHVLSITNPDIDNVEPKELSQILLQRTEKPFTFECDICKSNTQGCFSNYIKKWPTRNLIVNLGCNSNSILHDQIVNRQRIVIPMKNLNTGDFNYEQLIAVYECNEFGVYSCWLKMAGNVWLNADMNDTWKKDPLIMLKGKFGLGGPHLLVYSNRPVEPQNE